MIDGQVEDLSNMDLDLYLSCNRFYKKMDITVENNTITFTFEGKDQVVAGYYDIILFINEGQADQLKLVNKKVFELAR